MKPFLVSSSESESLRRILSDINFTQSKETQDNAILGRIFNLKGRIPSRIESVLNKFRESSEGTLVVRGLPLGKEKELILLLTSTLGMPFAHSQESELVSTVRPKHSARESKDPSYFTSVKFDLHTELPYVLNSPDFISLLCKDNVEGGYTYTSSINEALTLLTRESIALLQDPIFEIMIPPHFSHSDGFAPPRPIIKKTENGFKIRIRFDQLKCPESVRYAVDELFVAINEVKVRHLLEPGDLLIINNNTSLHGRSNFIPTYQKKDRELHRVYSIRESYKLMVDFDFENKRIHSF